MFPRLLMIALYDLNVLQLEIIFTSNRRKFNDKQRGFILRQCNICVHIMEMHRHHNCIGLIDYNCHIQSKIEVALIRLNI